MNFNPFDCSYYDASYPCNDIKDCTSTPDGRYADINNGCQSYYRCYNKNFYGHYFCNKGNYQTLIFGFFHFYIACKSTEKPMLYPSDTKDVYGFCERSTQEYSW